MHDQMQVQERGHADRWWREREVRSCDIEKLLELDSNPNPNPNPNPNSNPFPNPKPNPNPNQYSICLHQTYADVET